MSLFRAIAWCSSDYQFASGSYYYCCLYILFRENIFFRTFFYYKNISMLFGYMKDLLKSIDFQTIRHVGSILKENEKVVFFNLPKIRFSSSVTSFRSSLLMSSPNLNPAIEFVSEFVEHFWLIWLEISFNGWLMLWPYWSLLIGDEMLFNCWVRFDRGADLCLLKRRRETV